MKSLIVAFAFVLILSASAFSQAISFGLGADVTFPLENLQNQVETGYGATALAKFGLLPILDLTGGAEYLSFKGKSVTVNNQTGDANTTALGILVGGRLNFLVVAYAGLETGTYSFTKKLPNGDETITRGIIVPLAGVKLGTFDVGARYISAGDDTFWGFRGMIWF